MDQWFHVVTTIQEICHSTSKFVLVSRDYLVNEGPLIRAMAA